MKCSLERIESKKNQIIIILGMQEPASRNSDFQSKCESLKTDISSWVNQALKESTATKKEKGDIN